MRKEIVLPPIDLNDDILTPEEAGKLFRVSGWAMYKRAKKDMVPSHKIGKRVYFLKSELISYTLNS
ncbi:hypothetical protein SAMN02910409_2251 [Prevotellaceae bacterium HUN156]|nr:hypothetical protein SAMN02910409_2251 [Prevotellaceae bacterium HUN156]